MTFLEKGKELDKEKKRVILCVDDDKVVLDSLKMQLKIEYEDQYRYETAEDANIAFELIADLTKKHFDILLVISDWLLQGMKGDEFLIRVHNEYPQISTVLLTGHASDDVVENAKKNANLLTCLNKPWSLEDIINVITIADKKLDEHYQKIAKEKQKITEEDQKKIRENTVENQTSTTKKGPGGRM